MPDTWRWVLRQERIGRGTIKHGKRAGGPKGNDPPRSCVLVTAPTNAQVDNLLQRVQEDSYIDDMFREQVRADNPVPWLPQRVQRAAPPPQLRSFNQDKVQETLGSTLGC